MFPFMDVELKVQRVFPGFTTTEVLLITIVIHH